MKIKLFFYSIITLCIGGYNPLNAVASSTAVKQLDKAIRTSNIVQVNSLLQNEPFDNDQRKHAHTTALRVHLALQQAPLARISEKTAKMLAGISSVASLIGLGTAAKYFYKVRQQCANLALYRAMTGYAEQMQNQFSTIAQGVVSCIPQEVQANKALCAAVKKDRGHVAEQFVSRADSMVSDLKNKTAELSTSSWINNWGIGAAALGIGAGWLGYKLYTYHTNLKAASEIVALLANEQNVHKA